MPSYIPFCLHTWPYTCTLENTTFLKLALISLFSVFLFSSRVHINHSPLKSNQVLWNHFFFSLNRVKEKIGSGWVSNASVTFICSEVRWWVQRGWRATETISRETFDPNDCIADWSETIGRDWCHRPSPCFFCPQHRAGDGGSPVMEQKVVLSIRRVPSMWKAKPGSDMIISWWV